MDLSFGARLRLERERQQVALADIAAETKIKLSLLEALERDDLSQWPEGIYRRAYVRSYAQAIGLEPGAVVREFLEVYPDPAEAVAVDAAPDSADESAGSQPVTRLKRLFTSAIAAVPSLQRPAKPTVPGPTRAAAHEYIEEGEVVEKSQVVEKIEVLQPSPAETAPASDAVTAPVEDVPAPQEPSPSTVPPDLRGEDEGIRTEPTLEAAADLCTRLGRVNDRQELTAILEDAAGMLDAVGLIVWSCDHQRSKLSPWLAHGYSDAVLAHLPFIPRDGDNAIAAAFRSAETCVVDGEGAPTGAVVVPLLAPRGCVGVLALELRSGRERHPSVRALAVILAAQLVTLLGSVPLAEAVNA